jgi:hypothetical protein
MNLAGARIRDNNEDQSAGDALHKLDIIKPNKYIVKHL